MRKDFLTTQRMQEKILEKMIFCLNVKQNLSIMMIIEKAGR